MKVGGNRKGECATFQISFMAGVPMVIGHLVRSPVEIFYVLQAIFGGPLSECCVCTLGSSGILWAMEPTWRCQSTKLEGKRMTLSADGLVASGKSL